MAAIDKVPAVKVPRVRGAGAVAKMIAAAKPAPKQEKVEGTFGDMLKNMDKYAGKVFRVKKPDVVLTDQFTGPLQPIRGEFSVHRVQKYGFGRYPTATAVLVEGLDYGSGANLYQYASMETEVEEVIIDEETKARHEMRAKLRMNKYTSSIGADPEVFVETADGVVFPAFEFLTAQAKGSTAPFWDGYQAEFGTTPMTCMAYHTDEIQRGLRQTLTAARKKDKKAKLSVKTTMDIPMERLTTDDQKFVAFGCTPSMSAYDETFPDVDPRTIPFRSAGGHLHFSLNQFGKSNVVNVVKELDRVLGVISVTLFQYYDDPRRRLLYGRAGEYRTPNYGLEYRTLSNAWMIHPMTTHLMYEIGRLIIGQSQKGGQFPNWEATEDEVRKCINECDVELAHTILKRNSLALEVLLDALPVFTAGQRSELTGWLRDMIFNGVHQYMRKPDEHSAAWHLTDGEWVGHSDGVCGNILQTWNYVSNRAAKQKYID